MKNDLFYKAIFKSSIFSSLNKKTQNLYFEIIENCNSEGVVVDEVKVEALKKNVVEINKLSKENLSSLFINFMFYALKDLTPLLFVSEPIRRKLLSKCSFMAKSQ